MPRIIYRTKDGIRVPGVTTIIDNESGWNKRPLMWWAWEQGQKGINLHDEKQAAADVGTVAHKMIEAHIKDVPFDPMALPGPEKEAWETGMPNMAFDSWLRWSEDNNYQMLDAELSLVSEKLRVGGTFDAVMVNGAKVLVDWKTAKSIYDGYLVQSAAYAEIHNENFPDDPVDEVMVIRVGKLEPVIETYKFPVESGLYEILIEIFIAWRNTYELHKRLKKAR